MRKIFRNDELFPFLSGIVVSLACTILYEGIVGIKTFEIIQLVLMLLITGLLVTTTVFFMMLASEIKDLRTRFDRIKDEKISEISSVTSGRKSLDGLMDDFWARAFRWRADDDIMATTGNSPKDEVANQYVKRLKRKLTCLFGLAVGLFVVAMVILFLVQFIC